MKAKIARQIAGACGRPLDSGVRRLLEDGLDGDLSGLRVHTGPAADAMARSMSADAFTSGRDVFFREGRFDPRSPEGLRLLAHEAAHVLQQAGGASTVPEGAVRISRPGDRQEIAAELAAAAVVDGESGAAFLQPLATGADRGGGLLVQRHASWEHRLLGDVPQKDLVAVALKQPDRDEVLQRERQLMWLWHQNPDQVTEATIQQLCPWIRTLRLPANNVLLTYGELNSLPDYLANPIAIDGMAGSIVEPILQQVRQESYNRINSLLGSKSTERFAGSVATDWGEGLFNAIYETVELDNFTWNLGINHSDHYKGLLARNACHFAPFSWWRYYHFSLIARDLATKAHQASDSAEKARLTYQAWLNAGYADHFLQDSFAAGHLINKTLVMQWFIEWAAHKWYVPVSNWDRVSKMTTYAQPQLAAMQRYLTNTGSTDPQTAEEQPTLAERIAATGVTAPVSTQLQAAYQDYLTFLDGSVIQASSAALHDYYNARSVWVTSPDQAKPYQLWGDDTMLNGGEGVGIASGATHLSQHALEEILANGTTSITPQSIMRTFPTSVQARDGTMLPIQTWHQNDVRALCSESIFPAVHYYLLRPAPLAHMRYVSQDQNVPSPDGAQGDQSPMVSLETMGWDLTYATAFATVKQGLEAAGVFPKGFSGTDPSSQSTASGEWQEFVFAPGAPSNMVWLRGTVKSGTLQTSAGAHDISGSTWTVQFGLELSQDGAGQDRAAWNLGPAASGNSQPRLVDHSVQGLQGQDVYALMAIMDAALKQDVRTMGSQFGAIVLGDRAPDPEQQWLMPTSASFACETDPSEPDSGLFALLAMTEGRSATGKQPVVDRRLMDEAPAGTDTALVVGPSLFVNQMLKPAIQGLIQDSNESDFSLDVTGTVISNNKTLTWGSFTYDMGNGETATIHPIVPKGNLQLALNGEVIHVTMSNIHFPYPGWSGPGEITVSFDVQQFISLIFVLRDDGQVVMVPDVGTFNTPFNVTVIPSVDEQIFQIAVDAAAQVLMAAVGSLIEGATEAAEGALEAGAEGEYAAEFDEVEMQTFVDHSQPEDLAQTEDEAAEEAGNALANADKAGYLQKFKAAIIANKWKIFTMVLKKIVTFPVGQISNIAEWAAKYEFGQLPSINAFAETGMTPVLWRKGASFALTGGALRGALVLWGTTGQASSTTGAATEASRPAPVEQGAIGS